MRTKTSGMCHGRFHLRGQPSKIRTFDIHDIASTEITFLSAQSRDIRKEFGATLTSAACLEEWMQRMSARFSAPRARSVSDQCTRGRIANMKFKAFRSFRRPDRKSVE